MIPRPRGRLPLIMAPATTPGRSMLRRSMLAANIQPVAFWRLTDKRLPAIKI